MKLLVIGGIHGNEPLGLDVVEELKRLRHPSVDAFIANSEARTQDVRYVDADLNRVFPGEPDSDEYEVRRAHEVSQLIQDEYDLVLDFHNTHTPGNDCGFVGDRGDRTLAAEAARFLRLPRLVVANYDCINRYFPRCLSVEVSLSSVECRADLWVSRILALADRELRDLRAATAPPVYRFVGRVTREQAEMIRPSGWEAFKRIPAEQADALNLPAGAQAMFVDDAYTPANFAAIVVPSRLRDISATVDWGTVGSVRR